MATKIMVVDDNRDIRVLLSTWLKQVGYEVTEAEDGQKALNLFKRERPNLVFLDMLLPKKNGIDVCREMKSMPGAANIPVIMMTAVYKGIQYANEAKKSGADQYIEKPFEHDKILQLTHSLAGPPDVEIGDEMSPVNGDTGRKISLEGKLEDVSFPEILAEVKSESLTGELVIQSGTSKKSIYFENGAPKYTTSNQISDRLGITVLKQGLISKEQYDEAVKLMQESKSKMKIGQSMIKLGYITDYELAFTLREQYKNIMLSVFQWQEGDYKFLAGKKDRSGTDLLNVDIDEIILEGVADNYNISQIKEILGSLDVVFVLSKNAINNTQDGGLKPQVKDILKLVDGTKSLKGIMDSDPEQGEENALALFALYLGKYLRIKEVRGKDADSGPGGKPENAITPEMIRKKYEEVKNQNYYQILGVQSRAQPADIKKAYFRLAKLYHPDKFVEPQYKDLISEIGEVFNKISEAHRVLSSYQQRMEYEKSMSTENEDRETRQKFAKVRNAELKFVEAQAFFKRAKYDEAIEALEWAIDLNPDESEYFRLMAMSYMNKYAPSTSEFAKAESFLKKACDLRKDDAENYYWLGQLWKKNGEMRKAVDAFRQSLRLKPDYHEAKREIRLYEMRTGGKPRKKSGLFGKKND